MTSRPRRGFGPPARPAPLQADTPVTWVTKSNQQSRLPPNLEWEAPLRKHRSLVLHSVAEQNGVSMFRKGGHRPRGARAFLRCSCVIVTSQKSTQSSYTQKTHNTQKKNARRSFPGEPRRTILKGIVVVPQERRTRAQGGLPKTNTHPPQPVWFLRAQGPQRVFFFRRGSGMTTQQSVVGRR
jgi:hypothetical protein